MELAEELSPHVININGGRLGWLLAPTHKLLVPKETMFGPITNIETSSRALSMFGDAGVYVPNYWSIKLLMMYFYFKDVKRFKELETPKFTSYTAEGTYQLNRGRYLHALQLVHAALRSNNPDRAIVSYAMAHRDDLTVSLLEAANVELTPELLEFLNSNS